MKKLLIASTALSLAGGAAFAEMAVTVSGDAELGVDYNSEPGMTDDGMTKSKHTFVHEVGIDFSGSGATDGGLTFGGSAGFNSGGDSIDEGTVHVSGSFGKLTIGDNDSADLTAGGIEDIGMNGIGVDDMVEGLRGTTANQLRYDNSFGQIKIAISAGTKAGSAAVEGTPDTPAVTAEPADAWWAIGPDNELHVYEDLMDPPTFNAEVAFDGLYSISRNLDEKTGELMDVFNVDSDGEVGEDSIVGYGYKLGDDGKPELNDDDEIVLDADGGTPSPTLLDAFNRYAMAYDLGDDYKVGGENVAADPDDEDSKAQKNVDSRKDGLLTDNHVKAEEAIPGEPDTPAGKSDTEFAFGMSFNAGGVTIGVGYDSNKTVSMGAGFTTGEISTKLLYVKTEDNEDTKMVDEEMTGMGVDMAYSMGASTVTLAYGRRKPEMGEAMDAVGMGVTHDLGGGATMNAGFGKVDKKVGTEMVSQNKASIGLLFKF